MAGVSLHQICLSTDIYCTVAVVLL
jgi:hypothetical protein